MCKYLVTGGAGFIGSHIVERLLREGLEVSAIDDFSTGKEENIEAVLRDCGGRGKLEVVRGDIRHEPTLRKALEGVKCIFHEAALCSVQRSVVDPIATNSVNVDGTLLLLKVALELGVRRLIYASSSSVYGNGASLPNREDMRPNPCSPYALSKFTGEEYCRVFSSIYGMETVSLRYFNVFGPRQDANSQYAAVIPIFISRVMSGETPVIFGNGEQSRDFTFVEDVVEANLLACSKEGMSGRIYNIARGSSKTLNELVETLGRISGVNVNPTYEEPRPAEVKHSEAATERAETELVFKAKVSFEEGLEKTFLWFKGRRD